MPGNVPLYEWVDHLLHHKKEFVVAYCDINHFKPFNDAFGYSAGDEAIVRLSQIICDCVDRTSDFVGHVGGDDFILVLSCDDWQFRCEHILKALVYEHPEATLVKEAITYNDKVRKINNTVQQMKDSNEINFRQFQSKAR